MSLEVMLTREEEENLRRRHNIGQRVKAGVMTAVVSLGMIAGVLTYKPSKALALGDELPKVEASSPSWYLLQNQPLEAIIRDIQKTDIRLRIGSASATINASNYTLDAAPYIKNSRTMVPVRFITEGLGANVGWEGTEKKVMINYEGKTIELWIGKTNARVDGSPYILDAAPEIKNSRTFVPIRFIAENFGSQVGWEGTIKEVSIYKEKISQSINLNSDADKDGLSFSKEKAIGTNPNSKNTVYNSLNDKKLSELISQYPGLNIFAKYPDDKTGLTLPDKAMLNLDPRNPFNLDSVLNDEQAINYAKTKNLADNKDNIVKAVNLITENYGPKLGKALKLTASETNENIFKITVEELDDQGNIAKQQMDEMWNERAYKTKADNTALTLDDLTSTERFKAIILLNKTFGAEQINVMLSQSPVLQQTQDFCLAYFRTQYEDFVKTLYDASNSTELSLNIKVKDTNTFKKYVNQLGLYDYNAGELAVQMWKNADDALKAEIKLHPKTFLAIVSGFGPVAASPDAQKQDLFNMILKYANEHFSYHVDTEKILNGLADQEKDDDLRRPLENFDWLTLQFLLPNQSWTNAENVEKKSTFLEKIDNTFNYVEALKTIRDNAIKNFHNVKVQAHSDIILDFLSNNLGSASIDYVINIGADYFNRGYGTPWGETYTKETTGWPTTTDLEIANKLSYLFGKGTEKINDDEKITIDKTKGWAQIERIVNTALNLPSIEVRNRGPPSTLPEDNSNLLFAYRFEKDGYFMNAGNLKYLRLEKQNMTTVPGPDSICKIIMPYCPNLSEPFNKIYNNVQVNVKGMPFDDILNIKLFEELLKS